MQNDDLSLLGGSPDLPPGDLNLAGSHGVPDPGDLFPDRSNSVHQAAYGRPDLHMPELSSEDLARAPLTVVAEFAPDPLLPDLLAGPLPFALDLHRDPLHGDALLTAGMPAEGEFPLQGWPGLGFEQLQVTRDILAPDPLLPDLQQPEIGQQVTMPAEERPGNLAPDALDIMHQSLRYQQIASKDYPEVFMDQRGTNDRRSREFTLLMKGLDAEEQGREL
ncbi:MAG TPA: hypothetical protein VGN34_09760 [Ktedonobacteraceae bacterium]